jgi:hypothetical protein
MRVSGKKRRTLHAFANMTSLKTDKFLNGLGGIFILSFLHISWSLLLSICEIEDLDGSTCTICFSKSSEPLFYIIYNKIFK